MNHILAKKIEVYMKTWWTEIYQAKSNYQNIWYLSCNLSHSFQVGEISTRWCLTNYRNTEWEFLYFLKEMKTVILYKVILKQIHTCLVSSLIHNCSLFIAEAEFIYTNSTVRWIQWQLSLVSSSTEKSCSLIGPNMTLC